MPDNETPYNHIPSLLLASCAPKSSVPADYDQPWNVPTVCHKAMGYQYGFFGAIGCYYRDFDVDTLVYPPIPGQRLRADT